MVRHRTESPVKNGPLTIENPESTKYFKDPWQNSHEITTYERDYVASKLAD